ncbi:MAG TPA: hypothetical protein PKM70_01165 [Clostridia bacterium]|nr:hypothetical protein [Clostridia bacterium]
MSKVYAVDFDGTLCTSAYPDIGNPIPEVIEYIKELKSQGNRIILWTCRTDEKLDKALEWCKEQGLEFDAVNENLQEQIDEWGTDPRKIAAHGYIDDKAVTVQSILDAKGGKSEIEQKY